MHAGVRPGVPLEEQRSSDLLWIREPFLGSKANHGAIIVHGHTPKGGLFAMLAATLAGVPGIITGRNRHVSWGLTNTGSDTQDLYLERINPDNPGQYQTPAGWADSSGAWAGGRAE